MAMAIVAGKQLSKIQLIIGFLQFFVQWNMISYLWTLGWCVLIFLKSGAPAQEAPRQEQSAPGETYDMGRVEKIPFEIK